MLGGAAVGHVVECYAQVPVWWHLDNDIGEPLQVVVHDGARTLEWRYSGDGLGVNAVGAVGVFDAAVGDDVHVGGGPDCRLVAVLEHVDKDGLWPQGGLGGDACNLEPLAGPPRAVAADRHRQGQGSRNVVQRAQDDVELYFLARTGVPQAQKVLVHGLYFLWWHMLHAQCDNVAVVHTSLLRGVIKSCAIRGGR